MADDGAVTVYNGSITTTDAMTQNPFSIKVGLAQMLRNGAIVEVTNPDQAKIAESAGASCIVVSDLFQPGRISRMPDPSLVKEIKNTVSIPIMAKSSVGHFVESQILESVGVDYIDESEAMRRIREGAAMVRSQGDLTGSGNIVETIRSVRKVMGDIRVLTNLDEDEVFAFSKKISAPYDIVAQTKQMGRLPVAHFAAGGIVTPADAALMMQLGCDGVFIGQEVFRCSDPYKRVRAIVEAVRNYNDPHVLAETSCGLEEDMAGLNLDSVEQLGTLGTY
ncbi:hypothetical protein RHSIM_Rhsim08G0222300 [Rhododendron simsii]|uniref:PdxS/SNZ N-terminal domain-containing protein n=1 Tax=Rhododendron simsii TaxID=118357 RepID=A0A834GM64_RHOSS|nr:hypothetical protein RHSIM_Rhsim08G0222300 [Rhododendron simsii]